MAFRGPTPESETPESETAHFKRFRDGLEQLLQEGVVQTLQIPTATQRVPLLAAVGPLQFEVVQYRLESEYGATSRIEPAPWTIARWVLDGTPESLQESELPTGCRVAVDSQGRTVFLFTQEWLVQFYLDRHPNVRLSADPDAPTSG
jgi:peptide chain release factor 3